MKNRAFKLLVTLIVIIVVISGCGGTRHTEGAAHGRGVNNSHFRGY